MKKHIPNILTSLNLFSGCIAIVMAFENQFLWVVVWVIIAAVFDFLDGMAARLLKAPSKIGKELDSLADIVSFGVAPSVALFTLMRNSEVFDLNIPAIQRLVAYFSFIIPVFSALRLAKFNIDERQTSSFLGLPTPANAMFWISFVYGVQNMNHLVMSLSNPIFTFLTLLLVVGMSLLMVSEIPMFSFKVTSLAIKGNEKPLILILLSLVSILLWGIVGIAVSILCYIALSIIPERGKHKNQLNN